MNLTATQRLTRMTSQLFKNVHLRSNTVYMLVIVLALAGFEVFNFSSTDFALRDILGNQGRGMLSWPMILSLAFCGMDIAGIARILASPDEGKAAKSEWYLLGAWALAASMNAGLTWWGISVAIYNQPAHEVMIIDPMTYVTLIPVLVAVMVWVIRVLIIGALVTSFGTTHTESRGKHKGGKAFGFQTRQKTPPPGYTPMPSSAWMDERGFPS